MAFDVGSAVPRGAADVRGMLAAEAANEIRAPHFSSANKLWWRGEPSAVAFAGPLLRQACANFRQTAYVVRGRSGAVGVSFGGGVTTVPSGAESFELVGMLPAVYPEWLGDRSFNECHNTRFPYVVGEMAHAIASPAMVIAAGKAGMLGFIGAAGLAPARVKVMVDAVAAELDPLGLPWGVNLIHSPHDPALENAMADLLIESGVRRVSASAFMAITPAIVQLMASGLKTSAHGTVVRARHVFAKISRPETAQLFMSPPPAKILSELVASGVVSDGEARIAARLPIAEDITIEADSGGHTDNRPLTVILPRIAELRNELSAKHGYAGRIRIGAAGGLGTPNAVAGAFGLGADYVLTGSVNQSCVESGLSPAARQMIIGVDVADTAMAASADMFELGVKVQVLKRATMFAGRANALYDLYQRYDGLESLPAAKRAQIEKDLFRAPLEKIWSETEAYFAARNPGEIERAKSDPKHRMALVFRWYLGNSIRWAINGDADRRIDYQIWCGPAMGAFNAWSAGSFFDDPDERSVAQIGRNLLEGATIIQRAQAFRNLGVAISPECFEIAPQRLCD